MSFQPPLEQRRNGVRKPESDVTGGARSGFGSRGNERWNFVIGQAGNHRRQKDADGNAGVGECSDRSEPRGRRRRARLHHLAQLSVQRGERNENLNCLIAREL